MPSRLVVTSEGGDVHEERRAGPGVSKEGVGVVAHWSMEPLEQLGAIKPRMPRRRLRSKPLAGAGRGGSLAVVGFASRLARLIER